MLRFYAFFKESCVESSLESYRVRKVIVMYYLDDNSIEITEPKQMNSGIPQGAFLKRQKVLRADGSGTHISLYDFQLGFDIEFFGKVFYVYDCDVYTREFYENIGIPQGAPLSAESDNWEKKTLTKYIPQKDNSLKDFMEHKLGRWRSWVTVILPCLTHPSFYLPRQVVVVCRRRNSSWRTTERC